MKKYQKKFDKIQTAKISNQEKYNILTGLANSISDELNSFGDKYRPSEIKSEKDLKYLNKTITPFAGFSGSFIGSSVVSMLLNQTSVHEALKILLMVLGGFATAAVTIAASRQLTKLYVQKSIKNNNKISNSYQDLKKLRNEVYKARNGLTNITYYADVIEPISPESNQPGK